MSSFDKVGRRTLLRGMVRGGAVAVGLPLLEMFLGSTGTAYANGARLPVRFGTWHWGLGLNTARFVPKETGRNYKMLVETKALEPFQKHINLLTGYRIDLDGASNYVHFTGNCSIRTGVVPRSSGVAAAPSFETAIAAKLGQGRRFRSLDVACTGNDADSYSWNDGNVRNPAEVSPIALYQRIFGSGFQDPNSANFVPDPNTMVMKSVLSHVTEDRQKLMRTVGAADRARLDQYFTSIRQIENQLAVELQKPDPISTCKIQHDNPEEAIPGTDVDDADKNHELFTRLLLAAMACDQTRTFNMVYSDAGSRLRRKGVGATHHIISHEEAVDEALGVQKESWWFLDRAMKQLAYFIDAASSMPEGTGTMLDNMLVFAHSDVENARVHTVDGIPMMTIGHGGGRIKTGQHISGNGDPVTNVGLTLQQAMGVTIGSWGGGALETSKTISDLVV